jgi:hypothetical protein
MSFLNVAALVLAMANTLFAAPLEGVTEVESSGYVDT